MIGLPIINNLIRPRLVKDALSSVLIAAGFAISPRTDQSDEGVVVILDWDDYEHPEALLRYQQNGAKIVVLASDLNRREPDHDQIAALSGILTYDLSAGAFVHSLRLICSGERLFPRELTLGSKPEAPPHKATLPRTDIDNLSSHEREILSYLIAGHPNKEIARILGIGEATVKVHLESLLRKIGVDNRTQATIWALSNLPEPNAVGFV
jgi:two-component system nitrate/nitrite response regulator NarL